MRWGIYARDGHPAAAAFAEGLRKIGHFAVFRSLPDYRENCREDFDRVVVLGLRGFGRLCLSEYEAAGVPVTVVDYGYVNRVHGVDTWMSGYWQVGVGGLNRVIDQPCPTDRFDALGVKIAPAVSRKSPVILCTQSVGDASHPFDTEAKLSDWMESVEHDEVRQHPLAGGDLEPLDEMLSRAGKLITWNSNIGHDALLAGVPVEAHGDAPYKDVAMDERHDYFARVAYSQYTIAEMAESIPQRILIEGPPKLIAPVSPAKRGRK